MGDVPWSGDACSLVDAFRRGERSPSEELAATYAAADAGGLNAFCHVDREAAESAAAAADVSQPFGGVPIGVKALEQVAGWPLDHCSQPLVGAKAPATATHVERLTQAGVVLAAQTTSSEFGAVNLTRTARNGITRNPWDGSRTPGGSSGGSAAAVAGGVMTLATASDGGGSIRIPAGFCGLVGLKATFGRIPRSPDAGYGSMTVTVGCVSRSVRDTARWFDVANGHDARDPLSLVPTEGWESGLGTLTGAVAGLRVAVVSDWGGGVVTPETWAVVADAADVLIEAARLRPVDIDTSLPRMARAWGLSGVVGMLAALGDRWPDCADQLTPEVRLALEVNSGRYGIEARTEIEVARTATNEAMARIFDLAEGADLVITATNPDVAFGADGPLPDTFGGIRAGGSNNGRLTFPANLHGNPAISVPAGLVDGLPVGVQIIGRHFTEPLLLELAQLLERTRPWPLTAPTPPPTDTDPGAP